MRGTDTKQASMLSLLTPEKRVPPKHPLRAVKLMAESALQELSPLFDAMYSTVGRSSIPPERLLKASLLPPRKKPYTHVHDGRFEYRYCNRLPEQLMTWPGSATDSDQNAERARVGSGLDLHDDGDDYQTALVARVNCLCHAVKNVFSESIDVANAFERNLFDVRDNMCP